MILSANTSTCVYNLRKMYTKNSVYLHHLCYGRNSFNGVRASQMYDFQGQTYIIILYVIQYTVNSYIPM